ncbi:MAG TPA: NAD-dependent epimerase/dehydratase family protein [Pyrinomonadaceae bacterium]|jgi:2'-hydroxyisoflavone reductase
MRILIIGGTKFLGRHLIDAALKNNHEVTLFNRGRKYLDDALEAVEQIHGDRNADLEKLAGRNWDVCIDTCGYLPQSVKASAEFLREAVDQYIFVSSISAYKDFAEADFDETAPLAELTAEQRERLARIDPRGELTGPVLGDMYGALKALCERAAENAMPGRTLIVRPGLIVGEYDWTDRFTYWVVRAARGGEVLAPGNPERSVQFIDARDLAGWMIEMAEKNRTGVFNANGKPFALTFGKLLEEIKTATGSDARFTWATEEFLRAENVEPWGDMPLYLYESDESWRGFLAANVDRALENGLSFSPLRDTILSTLNWRKTIPDELKAGISAEREKGLLEKWREQ